MYFNTPSQPTPSNKIDDTTDCGRSIQSSSENEQIGEFERFWDNEENEKAIDRNHFLIAAFHRAVEDFTLEAEPYKSMKK